MRQIPLNELLLDFAKKKGRSPKYFLNILNGEDMTDKQLIETLRNIKNMCEEENCAKCDFNDGLAPHGLACTSCKLRFLAHELNTLPCNWDMDAIERIINE